MTCHNKQKTLLQWPMFGITSALGRRSLTRKPLWKRKYRSFCGSSNRPCMQTPTPSPGNTIESHGLENFGIFSWNFIQILVALASYCSNQIMYLLELKAIWITCRGFRVVCGISSRTIALEMSLLGAAISCVDVLAVPMTVVGAMHETNVIRECTLPGYELLCIFLYS